MLETAAAHLKRELDRGDRGRELYGEALLLREDVMTALENLLASLAEEDGLEWDNPRHRPSRRVRRELQGAFHEFFTAWNAVKEVYGEAQDDGTPQEVSMWFERAS